MQLHRFTVLCFLFPSFVLSSFLWERKCIVFIDECEPSCCILLHLCCNEQSLISLEWAQLRSLLQHLLSFDLRTFFRPALCLLCLYYTCCTCWERWGKTDTFILKSFDLITSSKILSFTSTTCICVLIYQVTHCFDILTHIEHKM